MKRIFVFHQFYLSQDGAGGSRWNQLTKFWSKESDLDITLYAGTVSYLASGSKGKTPILDETLSNFRVRRTWTYEKYNAGFWGRLMGYLSYCASSLTRALLDSVKNGSPQIVIVTSPPLFVGLSALALSLVTKSKLVFEVRDIWPESAISTGVLKNRSLIRIMYWMEKLLYKNSDLIAVLTPGFKREIASRFPAYADKIQVVTNAADLDLMEPQDLMSPVRLQTREKLGWTNKFVLAYFGAHGLANDLGQIVDAASQADKYASDMHFVFIGDGMMKPNLKAKAEQLGLKNVEFIEPIPKSEVGNYVAAADVGLAILKKSDTFKSVYPNKMFDYMCCGRPMLTNIDGDVRTIVSEVANGLYFEADKPLELLDAARKLREQTDQQRREMGQRGRDFVMSNFDREIIAARYLRLVRNLI